MVKSRQFSAIDGNEIKSFKSDFVKNEKVFSESVLLSELNSFFKEYHKDFIVISHLKEILSKDLTNKNKSVVANSQKKIDKVNSIINLLENVKKQQQLLEANRQDNIVAYIKAMNAYYEKFDISQRKNKNYKLLHSKEYKEYLQKTMVLSNYEKLSLEEVSGLIFRDCLTDKERDFAKKHILKDEKTFKSNLQKISRYKNYISKHFLPNSLKDAEEMVDGKYVDYDNIEKTRKIIEDIKKQINDFYKINLTSEKKSLDIFGDEKEELEDSPIVSDLKKRKFIDKNFNKNIIKTIDMNTKIIEFLLAKLEYFENFNICEKEKLEKEIFDLATQNKNLALNSLKLDKLSAKNMKYIIKQIDYSDRVIKESMDKTNEICANKDVEKFKRNMVLVNMFNAKINQILKNDVLNEENRGELYILDLANKNLRREEENIIKSLSGSYRNILKSFYDKQLVANCDKQIKKVNQVTFDDKNFDDNSIDKYINGVVKENKFDENSLITKRILQPNNISIAKDNVKAFECYNEKNKVDINDNDALCDAKEFPNIFIKRTLEIKIQDVKEKAQRMHEIKVKCGKGFFKSLFAKIGAFNTYKKSKFNLFAFRNNKYVKFQIGLNNNVQSQPANKASDQAIEKQNTVEEKDGEQGVAAEVKVQEEKPITGDKTLLNNINHAEEKINKELCGRIYKFFNF